MLFHTRVPAVLQEKAYSYQEVELQCHGGCPVPSGVLTPPLSSEKTEEPDRGEATVVKIRASMESPPPPVAERR